MLKQFSHTLLSISNLSLHASVYSISHISKTVYKHVISTNITRGSAIAEKPRDALRQLKYYGRFLTELLTRSSANPQEPCEHNVS